jgi:hypothetical protein
VKYNLRTYLETEVKRLLIAGAILAFAGHPAHAQIQSGSIVIWMATDRDLVLAADSRVFCQGAGCSAQDPIRDDDCKAIALNDHLIFASAGLQGARGGEGLDFTWSVTGIASTLAAKKPFDTAKSIDDLAYEWLKSIQQRVDQMCESNAISPDAPTRAVWSVAVFAGVTAKGVIHATEARFQTKIDPKIIGPCTFNPTVIPADLSASSGSAVHSMGTGAAVAQTYLQNPENLKREIPNLLPPDNSSNFTDWQDLAKMTYRVARIAIEQSGSEDHVGGPVDQLHLSAKGIEWLHRKPNCAEKQISK